MNLDKKFLGQVLTPKVLAEFMAKWLVQINPKTLLDPAAGNGALIQPFKKLGENLSVTAVEIDPEMAKDCKTKLKNFPTVEVINKDFFHMVKNHKKKYDAIIINPPYVKGQFIAKKQDFFLEFKEKYGMNLKQNSNLYSYFIIALTSLLNPSGRASILVPIELFNANFGDEIKAFLINNKFLKKVVFIDNKCNIFEGAVTTSAVIFLEAPVDGVPYNEITFHNVKNLKELNNLNKTYTVKKSPDALLKIKKWSSLKEDNSYAVGSDGILLKDYITTKRGIATGNNEFFHITKKQAKELKLRPESLKYCVGNINGLKVSEITEDVVKTLIKGNHKIFLVDIDKPNKAEIAYLDWGIKNDILDGYILSNKKIWYQQEKREPADILFNVFARGKINFLLNTAKVMNLTNNHCIYVKNPKPGFARQLCELLNSDEVQALLNAHKREYGNGLYKMEPKDLLELRISQDIWEKYIPKENESDNSDVINFII